MSDHGLEAGTTHYGASSLSVEQACGILRAVALRHGLTLEDADLPDLTAAVIAADAWALVLNTSSIEHPRRHGPAALKALTKILARAAGHGQPPGPCEFIACSSNPHFIRAAESQARWAYRLLGPGAASALITAAHDLNQSGADHPLSSYAEVLSILADTIENPRVFSAH